MPTAPRIQVNWATSAKDTFVVVTQGIEEIHAKMWQRFIRSLSKSRHWACSPIPGLSGYIVSVDQPTDDDFVMLQQQADAITGLVPALTFKKVPSVNELFAASLQTLLALPDHIAPQAALVVFNRAVHAANWYINLYNRGACTVDLELELDDMQLTITAELNCEHRHTADQYAAIGKRLQKLAEYAANLIIVAHRKFYTA